MSMNSIPIIMLYERTPESFTASNRNATLCRRILRHVIVRCCQSRELDLYDYLFGVGSEI